MLRRVLTPGRLRSVIVIIWALSVSVMLPLTVVRSVDHYPLLAVGQIITVCHEHWPRTVSFCSSSSTIYNKSVVEIRKVLHRATWARTAALISFLSSSEADANETTATSRRHVCLLPYFHWYIFCLPEGTVMVMLS